MDSKKDDTSLLERLPALQGDLPEVRIKSQNQPALRLGVIKKRGVLPAGKVSPGPHHIMAVTAQDFKDWPRKILVGQESHLGVDRVGLVLMCQVAGIGQARKNVVPSQARVVGLDLLLGLPGGELFQDELHSQTCSADDRLASEDGRINDDSF